MVPDPTFRCAQPCARQKPVARTSVLATSSSVSSEKDQSSFTLRQRSKKKNQQINLPAKGYGNHEGEDASKGSRRRAGTAQVNLFR